MEQQIPYSERKKWIDEKYKTIRPKLIIGDICLKFKEFKKTKEPYIWIRRDGRGYTVKLNLPEAVKLCAATTTDFEFIETIQQPKIKDKRKKIKPKYNKYFLGTSSYLTKNPNKPTPDNYYLKKMSLESYKFQTIQLTRREIQSITNALKVMGFISTQQK